jgi:hypothetical protein
MRQNILPSSKTRQWSVACQLTGWLGDRRTGEAECPGGEDVGEEDLLLSVAAQGVRGVDHAHACQPGGVSRRESTGIIRVVMAIIIVVVIIISYHDHRRHQHHLVIILMLIIIIVIIHDVIVIGHLCSRVRRRL